MAILNNQNDFTIASLKENLIATEYCLSFDKSNVDRNDDGCLGIPAMILMCTIVDTIGAYYRDSSYEFDIDNTKYKIGRSAEHFYVLNHDKYFNLKLSKNTIEDFYSTYRSKLIHNSSLPPNNYLIIDENEEDIFHLDSDNRIVMINLFPLFRAVYKACQDFIHHLGFASFSEQHKVSQEFKIASKNQSNIPTAPAASGVTDYSKYKL